ncbi:MAG: DUF5685 family protein [Fervidobacterium sp.]|nr:DUF5685 family protein [Fervidobacterium sp.]
MFGYVKPFKDELKIKEWDEFRKFYCGICVNLSKKYWISKFFMTYDVVFFSILLAAINQDELIQHKKFCFFTLNKVRYFDTKSVDYATNSFLLLLKYKLLDDYEDEKKIWRKFLATFFPKKSNSFTEDFQEKVKILLSKLSKIERNNSRDLDEGAKVFGELTGLFFEGKGKNEDEKIILKHLGESLGMWVYLVDAFDDLEKDVKRNAYNPFVSAFGYSGEDIKEFKDKIRPAVREKLYSLLNEVVLSYDLLDISSHKGILDNIIYIGLFNETERVLSGKKICRKS